MLRGVILAFTLGSMLCGISWSVPSLVVARVIQGLGGGMIQPLGMALLFPVTPPNQRGRIMGIYAMPVMVGPILGPTLGGYLVEYVDWRWVFYLNLPLSLLSLFMIIVRLLGGWLVICGLLACVTSAEKVRIDEEPVVDCPAIIPESADDDTRLAALQFAFMGYHWSHQ